MRELGARAILGLLCVVLGAGAGEGREQTFQIGEVAYIQNEAGESRVLFKIEGLEAFSRGAIRSARVEIPYSIAATQLR